VVSGRLSGGLGSAAETVEGPATLDICGSGPDADLNHVVIQTVGGSLEVNGVLREVEEVLILQHILEETGKTIHVEAVGETKDNTVGTSTGRSHLLSYRKERVFIRSSFHKSFKAEKSKDC
jgi:hypothetical protein